jgi:hypothetical protein
VQKVQEVVAEKHCGGEQSLVSKLRRVWIWGLWEALSACHRPESVPF